MMAVGRRARRAGRVQSRAVKPLGGGMAVATPPAPGGTVYTKPTARAAARERLGGAVAAAGSLPSRRAKAPMRTAAMKQQAKQGVKRGIARYGRLAARQERRQAAGKGTAGVENRMAKTQKKTERRAARLRARGGTMGRAFQRRYGGRGGLRM